MRAIVTALATTAVLVAGCSLYSKEPDFRYDLMTKDTMLPGYEEPSRDWTPGRQRYTQRFAWKMQWLANNLHTRLAAASPSKMKILMTTIVPVDDIYRATSFGRLCTEQLITELSRLGYTVVEARKTDNYLIRDKKGEFSLSRDVRRISDQHGADAVLVGMYSRSGGQALINVRLVDTSENGILAAASAMMNLRGDRFLNAVFRDEDEGKRIGPVGEGMRIRKKTLSKEDSPAEILESKVSRMAGQIGEMAYKESGDGSAIAVSTFVDVDNFRRAATFGRYLTEQLIGELTSLGFKVLEIRLSPDIFVDIRIGELGITREMSQIMMNQKADAIVVGAYTRTGDTVAVNARLVIGKTQEVIGVGQMIVDASKSNTFVNAMLENEITTVAPTETIEGF